MLQIRTLLLLDKTANSPFPVALNVNSDRHNFVDFMVQWSGNIGAPMVSVDMVRLGMACGENGKDCSDIMLSTHENFLWGLVDLAEGVGEASKVGEGEEDTEGEEGGEDGGVNWDWEQKRAREAYLGALRSFADQRGAQLFWFKIVAFSAVSLIVSFKRQPKKERYKRKKRSEAGSTGALVEYVTSSLKFEIKEARLKFSGYSTKNVKGGVDKLVDVVTAVYTDKVKFKWIELASCISLHEWKMFTGRSDGDDKYKDGDALRAAGNIAGLGAGFVLRGGTSAIADGFSGGVSKMGDGFEKGTRAIGLGNVGGGVNSVVSGFGDGIGSTVSGVGAGVGGAVMGVGKGAGQIFGGLGGGLVSVGKGLKSGIVDGDGEGFLKGLEGGAVGIGQGIGGGLETALTGVGDGVMSIGGGLFRGLSKVGKGVQKGVTGKGGKDEKDRQKERDEKKKKEKGKGGGGFFGFS